MESHDEFVKVFPNDRERCRYCDQFDVVMMVVYRGVFVVKEFLVVEVLRREGALVRCISFVCRNV